MGCHRGFIATFTYDSSQAPTYIRGHSITLAFVAVAWLAILCNVYVAASPHSYNLLSSAFAGCTAFGRTAHAPKVGGKIT